MAAGGSVEIVFGHIGLIVEAVDGQEIDSLQSIMGRYQEQALLHAFGKIVADDADDLYSGILLLEKPYELNIRRAEISVVEGFDLRPCRRGIGGFED